MTETIRPLFGHCVLWQAMDCFALKWVLISHKYIIIVSGNSFQSTFLEVSNLCEAAN